MFSAGIWAEFKDIENEHLKELADKIPGLMVQSRQSGTVKNYLFGFNRWKKWAAKYPEVDVLPAKPKYVAIFCLKYCMIQNHIHLFRMHFIL